MSYKKFLFFAILFSCLILHTDASQKKQKVHKVWIWQETGDCLYNIAKKYYRDGSKWKIIYEANKDKIKNPNKIYPKQILVIPEIE
ncbi:MAG: LysM peptidoglycan-binding domain-containing protein [Endomicrobiia bacterium]